MSNRYDNGSISVYSPQTMEELAFVPLMRRKKHDEVLTQQELIRSGLAKVDPSDKYFNEAVRLKHDIESKMDNTATQLSTSGVNNDMIGKTIALNREYQDLVSPTGKLGQINAEKINTKKTYDQYVQDAIKMGQSQSVAESWAREALLKHNDINQSPLYDDKGRISDFKVNQMPPKYYELAELTQNIATHAGMQSNEWEKSRSAMSLNSEGRFVVDTTTGGLTANNYQGLLKAADYLNRRIDSSNDPLRQNLDYNRISPLEAKAQIADQLGIYRTNTTKSIDKEGYSSVDWNKKDQELNGQTIYGEDYNTNEVGGNTQDYSEIDRIGHTTTTKIGEVEGQNFLPVDVNGNAVSTEIKQGGKLFTIDDIKDPKQKALYDNMWKKMSTTGVIGPDGKLHYLKPGFIKKGKNNIENAKAIVKMLKQLPAITLTSKIVTTDIDLDNSGFSSTIGKTSEERDKTMRKQLKLTNSGARKLLDPTTGRSMSFEEAQDKYDLEDVETATYHGYVSPLNWEEQSFNGTNSKASPHIVTIKTKDGKYKEFKTSRLNSDNIGININRYNDLNENYRNWTINHDDFVTFKSDSKSLNGLKVKYNTKNPTYDPQRGYLSYEILDKNRTPHYMAEPEFINSVNSTK